MLTQIKNEKYFVVALIAAISSFFLHNLFLNNGQPVALAVSAVLIGFIILASLSVAHHAELLAESFGEPYGTMILTIAAVLVEVVILTIMMFHSESPTLARDTIYSAVMLDINGILGLCAILGGFKYGEQKYNDNSSKSYIAMIAVAIGVSMVVPAFITIDKWYIYSIFTIASMAILYIGFLKMQTGAHSYFFSYNYAEKGQKEAVDIMDHKHNINTKKSIFMLISGIVVIGFIAEIMSKTLDLGLAGTGVPAIVAALVVATISASPEILTCLRAALANRMQPVVNIALGASLSTVILTVPVIEFIALAKGQQINMALTPTQMAMLFLTLFAAHVNLHDGESNAIEGMSHFVLFATFLVLAVLGA